MWLDLLAVSAWGGLVALDTTAAFQILISHPLISCSAVGLLLGNFPLGFTIGIILELVWLNELPMGAARFSEGNIGSTAAAAVAILVSERVANQAWVLPASLLSAVFTSMLAGRLVIAVRNNNAKIYMALIERESLSIYRIAGYHFLCISISFLTGILMTGISVWVFTRLLLLLSPFIPETLDRVFLPISGAFLGVGCGVLIYMFLGKKNWWLLAIGILLASFFLFL